VNVVCQTFRVTSAMTTCRS